MRLFSDVAVRNTILIAEAEVPTGNTLREWHAAPPPCPVRRQWLPQATYGADVFRPTLPALRVPSDVPAHALKHICYVSVGMVLNAHERLAPGQFRLDDLVIERSDTVHNRPYVGSEDLRLLNSLAEDFPFAAMRVRFLEYGTARVPALIRRPTFPELYNRPKLMSGEFGGAVYDDGKLHSLGFLTCNHSVFMFLPWHSLCGIHNRSLSDRVRELKKVRTEMELLSPSYPLGFLVGLFNSRTWTILLEGRAASSIAGRAQPNDYAEQTIPIPDAAVVSGVENAADVAKGEGLALSALLACNWRRDESGWHSPPSLKATVQQVPFGIARTRWELLIERPTARCGSLRREGNLFISGQRLAARLPAQTDEAAAAFLLRIFHAQGAATLQSLDASNVPVPLVR